MLNFFGDECWLHEISFWYRLHVCLLVLSISSILSCNISNNKYCECWKHRLQLQMVRTSTERTKIHHSDDRKDLSTSPVSKWLEVFTKASSDSELIMFDFKTYKKISLTQNSDNFDLLFLLHGIPTDFSTLRTWKPLNQLSKASSFARSLHMNSYSYIDVLFMYFFLFKWSKKSKGIGFILSFPLNMNIHEFDFLLFGLVKNSIHITNK